MVWVVGGAGVPQGWQWEAVSITPGSAPGRWYDNFRGVGFGCVGFPVRATQMDVVFEVFRG